MYNVENEKDIKQHKVIDMEALKLWEIDYHPTKEELLYGTISLNTLSKPY